MRCYLTFPGGGSKAKVRVGPSSRMICLQSLRIMRVAMKWLPVRVCPRVSLIVVTLVSSFCFSWSHAFAGNVLSQFISRAKFEHLPIDVLENLIEQLNPAPKDLIKLSTVSRDFLLASERVMVTQLRKAVGDESFHELFPPNGYQGEHDFKKAVKYYRDLIRASYSSEIYTDFTSIRFGEDEPFLGLRSDVRVFFSPYNPYHFFSAHRVVDGYRLYRWDARNGSNDLIFRNPHSIKDLIFFGSNANSFYVVTADGVVSKLDLERTSSPYRDRMFYRENSGLLKTHQYDGLNYQIAVYRKKLLIWYQQNPSPLEVKVDLPGKYAIVQNPSHRDHFLLIDQARCAATYWDFSRAQLLRTFTGRKICQAIFANKEAASLITLEKLFREENGRIRTFFGLKQVEIKRNKDIKSYDFPSSSVDVSLIPRTDKDNQFFTVTAGKESPQVWKTNPLEAFSTLDHSKFRSWYLASGWVGDPLPEIIMQAGTIEDPKLVSWTVAKERRVKVLHVWSGEDLKPKGVIRSNEYSYFNYPDGIAVAPLNPDSLLINSRLGGLYLKDLKDGQKSILMSKGISIDAYGINPYYPHVIVAIGDGAYYWNLLDSIK